MNVQEAALIKIIEKCSEIQKVCTKAMRFGLNNIQEGKKLTNFELLNEEIKDLEIAYSNFELVTGLKFTSLNKEEFNNKLEKIKKYNELSIKLLRLNKKIK